MKRNQHAPLRAGLACLALSACGAVQAQNVSMYGLIDVALDHVTNVNAKGDSLTHVAKLTGAAPSRLGFRGVEDLGGGYSAIFNLESGLQVATGGLNNGGRLFGRAAYVGLNTPYGRFTLGRQFNMTVQGIIATDVMGPALYSLASIDAYLPNSMTDNTIAYIGTYRNVTVGATYSLGRDTGTSGGPSATNCPGESASDHRACTQWTMLAKYEVADYGVAVTHDVQRGGPNALFGLNDSRYTDTRTIAGGWFRSGNLKVAGGLLRRERALGNVTRSNLWYLGATYDVAGPFVIDGEVARYDVRHSADDSTLFVVRANYLLSKKTKAYAMAGRMRNDGMAATPLSGGTPVGVGKSQNGVMAGIQVAF